MVNGEKMSKSAGNFFTLRDLLQKGYSGRAIRWVLLSCHYRKKLNFTFDALTLAEETLKKFSELFARLRSLPENTGAPAPKLEAFDSDFYDAIGDDLNISAALAVLFNLQREANRLADANQLDRVGGESVLALFRKFDRIFGCLEVDKTDDVPQIPDEVVKLAEQRQNARKNNYCAV